MPNDTHAVLTPLSLGDFLADYWESCPLHVARKNREHFASLLGVHDIESLLSTRELFFPAVQLTQQGGSPDPDDYTDSHQQILALRLMQLHAQGATVVLSQAHLLFETLGQLCREMTQLMQMYCQANVYLSPAGHQGFNAHYDTHDVFIVQIGGTKRFNFYDHGVDLPFTDDKFDRSTIDSAQITQSVNLQAGDTLYIPRGLVHDAVADGERSLHITLGFFPYQMRDLLQSMVQVVAEQDRRFRQSVLTGHLKDDQLHQRVSTLVQQLADPALIEEALLRQLEQLSLSQTQQVIGSLAMTEFADSITIQTPLIMKPLALIRVEQTEQELLLHTFGQVLTFNEPMSSALKLILTGQRFTPAELLDLSDYQRLALCRRLIQESLLEAAVEPA